MYEWIGSLTADEGRLHKVRQSLRYVPNFIIMIVCFLIGILMFVSLVSLRRRIVRNMKELLRKRTGGLRSLGILFMTMAFFSHLVITVYELLIVAPNLTDKGMSDERKDVISNNFHCTGIEHVERALQNNKGVIIFAAHTGNFFYYYWWISQKYDCLAVATANSEELRPIYLTFQKLGCQALDYDQTPPIAMLNTLRRHLRNNGVVFLLGDFWRDTFPPSTLFDLPTRSPGGAAMLALHQSVPIVPLYGRRSSGLRHQLEFGESIQLDEQYDKNQKTDATNSLNKLLEQMILRSPAQWFYWFNVNDRWEKEEKQFNCPA